MIAPPNFSKCAKLSLNSRSKWRNGPMHTAQATLSFTSLTARTARTWSSVSKVSTHTWLTSFGRAATIFSTPMHYLTCWRSFALAIPRHPNKSKFSFASLCFQLFLFHSTTKSATLSVWLHRTRQKTCSLQSKTRNKSRSKFLACPACSRFKATLPEEVL